MTFSYMLAVSDGFIRLFVLVGIAVGFVTYYCTVGSIVMKISGFIISLIKKFLRLLYAVFLKPVIGLASGVLGVVKKLLLSLYNALKEQAEKLKYCLKRRGVLLYNQFSARSGSKAGSERKKRHGKLAATIRMKLERKKKEGAKTRGQIQENT